MYHAVLKSISLYCHAICNEAAYCKVVSETPKLDIPKLHFECNMRVDAEGKTEGFAAATRAQEPCQELQSAG